MPPDDGVPGGGLTMDDTTVWAVRPSPAGRRFRHWSPETVAELPRIRGELRGSLSRLPAHRKPAVEETLLLLLDELLSNGLRHGRRPVTAEIRRTSREWVLEVGDQAAASAPRTAVDRDPAFGGMGLRIVAGLSSTHGWFIADGRKYVWGALSAW